LLIDLENCPNQIKNLNEDIVEFHKVVVCYAHTGIKIPLDWLLPLNEIINQNRLEIFKMPNGGKNSADFGIAFLAGSLANEYKTASYYIVSNDKGLNHIVDLLKNRGNFAERLGKIENKKMSKSTDDLDTLVNKYCGYLLINDKNRPNKKDSLLNSINSKFKDASFSKDIIFNYLLEKNIVSMTGKKIIYNNKIINERVINV